MKRKRAALLFMCLVLVLAAGCGGPTASTSDGSGGPTAGNLTMSEADTAAIMRNTCDTYKTVSEALASLPKGLPAAIIVPKSPRLSALKEVYVLKRERISELLPNLEQLNSQGIVRLNFADGKFLGIGFNLPPYQENYPALAAEFNKTVPGEATTHSSLPVLVKVRGNDGIACEAGTDKTPRGSNTRAAYVEWSEGPLTFLLSTVKYDPKTTSSDLVELANSFTL